MGLGWDFRKNYQFSEISPKLEESLRQRIVYFVVEKYERLPVAMLFFPGVGLSLPDSYRFPNGISPSAVHKPHKKGEGRQSIEEYGDGGSAIGKAASHIIVEQWCSMLAESRAHTAAARETEGETAESWDSCIFGASGACDIHHHSRPDMANHCWRNSWSNAVHRRRH